MSVQGQLFEHLAEVSEFNKRTIKSQYWSVEKQHRDWPTLYYKNLNKNAETAQRVCLSYEKYMEDYLKNKESYKPRSGRWLKLTDVLHNEDEQQAFWQKYHFYIDSLRQIIQQDTLLKRLCNAEKKANPEPMYATNDSLKALWMHVLEMNLQVLAEKIVRRQAELMFDWEFADHTFDQLMPIIQLHPRSKCQKGHWIEGEAYLTNYHHGSPYLSFQINGQEFQTYDGIATLTKQYSSPGIKKVELDCKIRITEGRINRLKNLKEIIVTQ